MRVFVCQVYVEVGAVFPFTLAMQQWLGQELTAIARPRSRWLERYGADFDLNIRVSARRSLTSNDIRGPSVSRKGKDVAYSIFLPYTIISQADDGCAEATGWLLDGIGEVFRRADVEAVALKGERARLVDYVCTADGMLERPWVGER